MPEAPERELTFAQAIREALAEEMRRDGTVCIMGEDVADLGGLVLAYRAWRTATSNQRLAPVDGLTPDQRFFVGYAQWACANVRPEVARLRARTDPHSPSVYRVNGLVANVPEFGQAFGCKAGAPMTKPEEKVCKIW